VEQQGGGAMILQTLDQLYHRMLEDPTVEVPHQGFRREKIHLCMVLHPDGSLADILDLRQRTGRGRAPEMLEVPESVSRTSTQIAANFLWDNTGYALGADAKKDAKRTRQQFAAFRKLAHDIGDGLMDPGLHAVLHFLDHWEPSRADEVFSKLEKNFSELSGLNMVFRLLASRGYVHDSQEVRAAWLNHYAGKASPVRAFCLVSGDIQPIARLHPKIKGVAGAQTSGASLVSFNRPAFTSYGKTQSYNAPVSEACAQGYTTALNHLLLPDNKHRVFIGQTTVVFWTEKEIRPAALLGQVLSGPDKAEDPALVEELGNFLRAARAGQRLPEVEAQVGFYVLGLSPNASRLSVRFFVTSTVGEMQQRLGEHFRNLELETVWPSDPEFPSFWRLLLETAPQHKSENIPDVLSFRRRRKHKSENIPDVLSGQLQWSVLEGLRYPESLLTIALGRIRADQTVSYLRAAILKAVLLRNHSLEVKKMLDPQCENIGYLLGRLFAVLEKAQQDALPDINTTIKDRFFGAASATPRAVFPRLVNLAQHHIAKAKYGYATDNLLGMVTEKIDACKGGFPAHLKLEDQGMFALGYYHQRNDNFRKDEDKIDPIRKRSQS
jgi:CRISPR-associated protein Csd1